MPKPKPPKLHIVSRTMTEIPERAMEFIRHPWFLRAALTEIIGDGKLGKSLVLLDEIARLSHQHQVGVVAAEDAVDAVIKPRLRLLDANLDTVHFIDGLRAEGDQGEPIWLRLPGHLEPLEEWVREHDLIALFFDPITAFVDTGLDLYHPQDAREILTPLKAMVERLNIGCAFIRHIGKDRSRGAAAAGLGSVELRNIVRSQWLVGRKPGDRSTRIMANNGANYLNDDAPALSFTIEATTMKVARKSVEVPRLVWGLPVEGVSADDLMSDETRDEGTQIACEIIAQLIKGEKPIESTRYAEAMKANDITRTSWERAERRLNVRRQQVWSLASGDDGGHCWYVVDGNVDWRWDGTSWTDSDVEVEAVQHLGQNGSREPDPDVEVGGSPGSASAASGSSGDPDVMDASLGTRSTSTSGGHDVPDAESTTTSTSGSKPRPPADPHARSPSTSTSGSGKRPAKRAAKRPPTDGKYINGALSSPPSDRAGAPRKRLAVRGESATSMTDRS